MKHRKAHFSLDQISMNRRNFLRKSIFAAVAVGASSSIPLSALAMECQIVETPRTLVNLMLQGGADLRFLFMPAPNHPNNSYRDLAWAARRSLYEAGYENYQQMFDNEYLLATDPTTGFQFGIYRRAAWLKEQFELGRVAVVANAYCSRNRRHDQSILNADVGEPDLDVLNFERAGWGGRLVEFLGDGANSVELASEILPQEAKASRVVSGPICHWGY